MKENEVLKIFEKAGALLKGHFLLSSGLHSAQYLQCALVLQHPEYTEKLCAALAAKFKSDMINKVVAPALGGILVSYEVARSLKAKSLFTERVDGKMTLRRGFELNKSDRVLVVEDVVTTGLSTREVADVVNAFGATVAGIGAIVDRSNGKAGFRARFESLIKIDIPSFKKDACPLCKRNIPLVKPGSRK